MTISPPKLPKKDTIVIFVKYTLIFLLFLNLYPGVPLTMSLFFGYKIVETKSCCWSLANFLSFISSMSLPTSPYRFCGASFLIYKSIKNCMKFNFIKFRFNSNLEDYTNKNCVKYSLRRQKCPNFALQKYKSPK